MERIVKLKITCQELLQKGDTMFFNTSDWKIPSEVLKNQEETTPTRNTILLRGNSQLGGSATIPSKTTMIGRQTLPCYVFKLQRTKGDQLVFKKICFIAKIRKTGSLDKADNLTEVRYVNMLRWQGESSTFYFTN
ncbi:hypothetical protein CYY_010022 [Polysphondylium violaceum]|uniref:Uncharacterized protein n=1 Tax=Polysphondylium violaceum TaxID=133409 RepID=A0A8J4PJK8_9MYCE|nr:hypothetical protein CYY_010022 [Polysphondylium violaceum]